MQSVVSIAPDGISIIRKLTVLSHPSSIWKLLEWRLCRLQVRSRGSVHLQTLLLKSRKRAVLWYFTSHALEVRLGSLQTEAGVHSDGTLGSCMIWDREVGTETNPEAVPLAA